MVPSLRLLFAVGLVTSCGSVNGGGPLHLGDRCNPGDNCGSGTCVDGRCCNSACSDNCAACDVAGKEGTCSPVTGAPHGSRTQCTGGTGPCAGTCDGVTTTACTFPTVSCGGAASCSAGVGTTAGMCQSGQCNSSMMACADGLCGATACETVAQVAVGADFACALLSDRTVRCWGKNSKGQLGQGGTDVMDRHTPTPVPGLTNVMAIGAGDEHACAVMTDNTIKCWGFNGDGELGIGTADNNAHTTPTSPCATGSGASCVPLTGVSQVAGSPLNTCAVLTTGHVQCWGDNLQGQIGDGTDSGTANNNRLNPTTVCTGPTTCGNPLGSLNGGIQQVVMGWYYVCALDGQNEVFCWGENDAGEDGRATTTTHFDFPQVVGGINLGAQHPTKLAAGGYTICAVVSDGTEANNHVRCWGYGAHGNRGDSSSGANAYGPTPVTVCNVLGCGTLLAGATAVAGSNDHMCAVAGGAVYCWGENNAGQLGIGTVSTAAPTFATFATASLITTGALAVVSEADGATTCASLQTGGTLRCWGYNADGEIGDGTTTTPQPTPHPQMW